ncbi:MAG TPA: hypothetical protein VN030_06460 [Cellvibrio sp.]|nr:hypothetical protein [Cellvibrio sp.]
MFYFLRENLFDDLGLIQLEGHTVETAALDWIDGQKFSAPLPLQTLILDPQYGNNFPDFFDTTVPVMSGRLASFLRKYGADNIDAYPVMLHNKASGEYVSDYFAVNIIGCFNAAKLEESQYRLRFGKPYFTGRIALDNSLTPALPCFRLLYGPGLIVISQHIAEMLARETWTGILVQATEDYAGV